MSMSESDQQLDSDGDKNNNYSLPTQGHAIPTDFGEEDLAFVEELNCLFSPEEEDLPPYFVQTLLEAEDPQYYPLDPGFEKKTSARVFRHLKLRRRLYHDPRTLLGALSTGISGIYARRSLLALTAAFVFIMLITVAFTAPSFGEGVTMLLQGARGGAYQVNHYPNQVHRRSHDAANPQPREIALAAAQQQLHFKMYWPQYIPQNYSLDSQYLLYQKYQQVADQHQPWADGPIVELVYTLPETGATPKGTGQIVIREFKPSENVLQVVQDDAAFTIQPDQFGRPKAIYVNGQWRPTNGASAPEWAYGGRSEVIYQQNGVVFWIASDQRDGIGEKILWDIAQSMQTIPFNHLMAMNGETTYMTRAPLDDVHDPFVTDILVIPDGGPGGMYFMNVSSYQALKTVKHSQ
jgi:hypothetical protein